MHGSILMMMMLTTKSSQAIVSFTHPDLLKHDSSILWPFEFRWRKRYALCHYLYTNTAITLLKDRGGMDDRCIEAGTWMWQNQVFLFRVRIEELGIDKDSVERWVLAQDKGAAVIVEEMKPSFWCRYFFWTGSGPLFSMLAILAMGGIGTITGMVSSIIFKM